jgi:hypothetical protein
MNLWYFVLTARKTDTLVDMATIDDESQYYQQGREAFVAHYVM